MIEKNVALNNLPLLEYESARGTVYGCDQNLYPKFWQRQSGCGPAAAATALQYLGATRPELALPFRTGSDASALAAMEFTWAFITPRFMGVNSAAYYARGLDTLLSSYHVNAHCETLDISMEPETRPTPLMAAAFISASLSRDIPVAFLNLHSGALHNLEGYHWTLIVALTEKDSHYDVTVYEQGKRHILDLGLWLRTTKRGGGFAAMQFS